MELTFSPVKLNANGILNVYVSASNSTKKLEFEDV